MLDQSFSAHNFYEIFQVERRKGNIRKEYFPAEYLALIAAGHDLQDELRELKKIGRSKWTDEQKLQYQSVKDGILENQKSRRVQEQKWLEDVSANVNKRDFRLVLKKVKLGDEWGYTLPEDAENLFVMKTLQLNLKKIFKVSQANRHRIMTQVQILMNDSIPKYVIRTDVHHFYESIPQARLIEMLKGSTLLSKMSVRFIRSVLQEYEDKKDATEEKGLGVPRGVGISAYLSEIYMRDLDEKMKHRPEVVFYVRYVDDIFMILSSIPHGQSLRQYYDAIRIEFMNYQLKLMNPDDSKEAKKVQLLDLAHPLSKNESGDITYLGYKMLWTRNQSKKGDVLKTDFTLSDEKSKKIRERIDAAFKHFEDKTKYCLSDARKDLRDCLRFIVGNYRLSKSKSGIKAGIYYSNDLLTDPVTLSGYTKYLHSRPVRVYPGVFSDSASQQRYIDGIIKLISGFDFCKSWNDKTTYSLKDKRIKEVSRWL